MATATRATTRSTPAAKKEKASKPATTRKRKIKLAIDKAALKKIQLVAVAYSYVERDMFPTEDAYKAEVEVQDRAKLVAEELDKLGIPNKTYPADQYFVSVLLVDDPDFVLNLVDTLRGKDSLQTTIPAALELANIPYTGAGMMGLVIGNNRMLTKELLTASDIPTPDFQFIRRAGTNVKEELGVPLIVKLNESGGSVAINNNAVQETVKSAQKQVDDMITTYKVPVVVEKFIDGTEINVIVFDDGRRKHTFLAQKKFAHTTDGKHSFTSLESYDDVNSWKEEPVKDEELAAKISALAVRAFTALGYRDYAKFDVRVEDKTGIPYFTDANPNTAFGPQEGYPIRDIMLMYGIPFEDTLASLMSKYAKKIKKRK